MSDVTDRVPDEDKKSEEQWDEHFQFLICDVFKSFLLDYMPKPSHLIVFMQPVREVMEVTSQIYELENLGEISGACESLLTAIQKSDERGRWQMFLHALKNGGEDTLIVDTLLGGKDSEDYDWERHKINFDLLRLFVKPLQEHLNLKAILDAIYSEKLLHSRDFENLKMLVENKPRNMAVWHFLLVLHRGQRDWYNRFLSLLFHFDDHHRELARIIDPDFCTKEAKKEEDKRKGEQGGSGDEDAGSGVGGSCQESSAVVSSGMEPPSDSGPRDALSEERGPAADMGHGDALSEEGSPADNREPMDALSEDRGPAADVASCACRCCTKVVAELAEVKSLLTRLLAKKNDGQLLD